ncbi:MULTISPECIES: hypothetical protein [unclassified Microbacterium]|uniref:hypothetical protein n=1 Tax=unclassified Microbacterium TaxID=2609290 RepID=UPI00341BA77D
MTTITHATGVITPTIVDGYTAARSPRTIMHPILGRDADDVTLRPASLRRGSLTLVFALEVDARAAVTALTTPQVLTLADPDVSIGMSFVVAEDDVTLELDDETRDAWIVTTPFREVRT